MSTNKGGAQGERAAEEVKGGLKGLNNLSEGLRHNINAFADDLLSGSNSNSSSTNPKTHDSTGFSSDAKAAGKAVERTIGGEKPAMTSHTGPAGTHGTGEPVVGSRDNMTTGAAERGL